MFIEGDFVDAEVFFCVAEKADEGFSDGACANYMDYITICHKFILPKVGAYIYFEHLILTVIKGGFFVGVMLMCGGWIVVDVWIYLRLLVRDMIQIFL